MVYHYDIFMIHSYLFEYYVITSKRDRYNLMCSIDAYEINHKLVNYEASSGGCRTLPSNLTESSLISFGLTLNFIERWFKSFETNCEIQTEIIYEKNA